MAKNSHHDHLHIYFFPFMATGHMIPIVDTAKQFARHDTVTVKATIILSNLNEPLFRDTIERERQLGFDISIRQVTFPSEQVGLPEDFSGNLSSITSPDMCLKLDDAIYLLKQPIEDMLKQDMPDCIVSDLFIPWAADVAAKLRIPNIIFHVVGFFPLSVHHSLIKHKPYDGIESDSDLFVVPGLPHAVKLTKGQLPDSFISRGHEPEDQLVATKIMENARQNEIASYGAVFNSFEEMEPGYAEHYKANIARKAWHFGPVSLCNKDSIIDKAQRGGTNMKYSYYLDWLSTKEPNSVVYVCFGTLSSFSSTKLREIAIGLESCGHPFIWAVPIEENKNEEWLPQGFETRIEGKGLITKSWVPQVLILEHESVGGFLTHCGWNSLLESVTAGKPMITWPISSEQFYNERLVTDILKIGVSVGNVEWTKRTDAYKGSITAGNIAKAVNKVMDSGAEEAIEMRNRANALSDKAKKAVEKGGSSYNDLDSLLKELRLRKYGTCV